MSFLREEPAQELIEYAVLLVFVFLCSTALFVSSLDATAGIWSQISALVHAARGVVRSK